MHLLEHWPLNTKHKICARNALLMKLCGNTCGARPRILCVCLRWLSTSLSLNMLVRHDGVSAYKTCGHCTEWSLQSTAGKHSHSRIDLLLNIANSTLTLFLNIHSLKKLLTNFQLRIYVRLQMSVCSTPRYLTCAISSQGAHFWFST